MQAICMHLLVKAAAKAAAADPAVGATATFEFRVIQHRLEGPCPSCPHHYPPLNCRLTRFLFVQACWSGASLGNISASLPLQQ